MFLDVVFISYDEPNADENWNKLLELVPYAIRVHGVKGIAAAHKSAAASVTTSHFFCVDADNVVDETFNFEKIIDFQKNDKRIHVWGCKNSVNGLAYGYGGIKLFPANQVNHSAEHTVDFCTSVASENDRGFRFHEQIASTTCFNTTSFGAWKSGFRECAKLSSQTITNDYTEETMSRLKIWMSTGLDAQYGDFTIAGARAGALYGIINKNDVYKLSMINDFDFCRKYFDSTANKKNIEETIFDLGVTLYIDYDIVNVFFRKNDSEMIKSVMYNI
jgi:hypothetical protein